MNEAELKDAIVEHVLWLHEVGSGDTVWDFNEHTEKLKEAIEALLVLRRKE